MRAFIFNLETSAILYLKHVKANFAHANAPSPTKIKGMAGTQQTSCMTIWTLQSRVVLWSFPCFFVDFSEGSKTVKNGRANARLAKLKRKDKAMTNHFSSIVLTICEREERTASR